MKNCDICSTECHRSTFTPSTGWVRRHEKCEPNKPHAERMYARGHIPMSYVPANYWVSKANGKGKLG